MKLNNFIIDQDTNFIGWMFNAKPIRLIFNNSIQAVPLKSLLGVVVVENNGLRDNVKIYNGDGTIKCQIKNPQQTSVGFGDVYYVDNELTIFNRWRDARMMGCVISEDGVILREYEAR